MFYYNQKVLVVSSLRYGATVIHFSWEANGAITLELNFIMVFWIILVTLKANFR